MAAIIRVLGQAAPAAAAETALYTCATTSAVISTLAICNTSASASDSFSVRVCVGGAGDVVKQLLFSLASIAAATTVMVTVGITLANGDVVKVLSTNGTTVFNLFGQENS